MSATPLPTTLTSDTQLPPGVHVLTQPLHITADGVTLDGSGAHLIVPDGLPAALIVRNARNVTLRNLAITGGTHAIRAEACQDLTITDCAIRGTAEVAANTEFLDIWRPIEHPYGGAILLVDVHDSAILNNDLQHQMCGMLSYGCQRLTVRGNNASYNSGFGFHLNATQHSLFETNIADYCNRWHPRGDGGGHLGADASGFVLVNQSSHNTFRGNFTRLGGDGVFLSGLSHSGVHAPCDHNLFEGNDVSHSPNNGFEATFSAHNVFRDNRVVGCNYGFWLGFSSENTLEDNHIEGNRRAGLAVENGRAFEVRGNAFSDNGIGLLAWSKHVPAFAKALPENITSRDWHIAANRFALNRTAIRIAANQNHGVHPHPPAPDCPAPHGHRIEDNDFMHNGIAVQAIGADDTHIANNRYAGDRQIELAN